MCLWSRREGQLGHNLQETNLQFISITWSRAKGWATNTKTKKILATMPTLPIKHLSTFKRPYGLQSSIYFIHCVSPANSSSFLKKKQNKKHSNFNHFEYCKCPNGLQLSILEIHVHIYLHLYVFCGELSPLLSRVVWGRGRECLPSTKAAPQLPKTKTIPHKTYSNT